MSEAWDVIPDIHADPRRLERTLDALGEAAPLAFLGDFIDAGKAVEEPDDTAVLSRVRGLIEAEGAVAVMGNHELNAVLFHTLDHDGRPLRPHTDKNRAQHRSFVERFGVATPEAREWTEWFLTLPLWRDLGGLRLVHACWDTAAIEIVAARRPNGRLHHDDLAEVAAESTAFGQAVKTLVSGPETTLPQGYSFSDAGGHLRRQVRLAWWRSKAGTWREAALSVPNVDELPPDDVVLDAMVEFYPDDAPPVLVGHYKMSGPPTIEAPHAACLDFPRRACAYRWRGEGSLDPTHLVDVDEIAPNRAIAAPRSDASPEASRFSVQRGG